MWGTGSPNKLQKLSCNENFPSYGKFQILSCLKYWHKGYENNFLLISELKTQQQRTLENFHAFHNFSWKKYFFYWFVKNSCDFNFTFLAPHQNHSTLIFLAVFPGFRRNGGCRGEGQRRGNFRSKSSCSWVIQYFISAPLSCRMKRANLKVGRVLCKTGPNLAFLSFSRSKEWARKVVVWRGERYFGRKGAAWRARSRVKSWMRARLYSLVVWWGSATKTRARWCWPGWARRSWARKCWWRRRARSTIPPAALRTFRLHKINDS